MYASSTFSIIRWLLVALDPGKEVEIDGRVVDGHWVFGGMERGSGDSFMVEVPRRDAATLLPIIATNIRPGTIVYSNELVSYPYPDSQQLRMDYITATWKVGLAHRSNFLVLWILDFGEPIKLQLVVTSQSLSVIVRNRV